MKTFKVMIEGVSPLLQHNPQKCLDKMAANQGKGTRRVHIGEEDPRAEAESVAYRDPKTGVLYFPSTWIFGNLRDGAAAHKQTGSRKSMKFVVPAAIRIKEYNIMLTNGDGKSLAKHFEVDSRRVVNPATKGTNLRHRPRLDEWAAEFHLVINEQLISPDFVKQLLDEGGSQVGIGDYRPAKFGPFGTFTVTSWKEIGGTAATTRGPIKKALRKTVPTS